MPFAAHGYASNFTLSLFDRYYKPNLSLEDGLKLADLCIAEIQTRFLIAQPNFVIKVSDLVLTPHPHSQISSHPP